MDNDYNEIATRIKNRRNKNNKHRKDKKITFKILNRLLGLLSLILAFLIYAYKDPDASLINSIFKTNINLSSVNAYMNKITKPLLSFLNININSNEISDQEVNAQVKFIEVGEYTYTNSNNTVYSIGDGTILNVSEDDYGYIVYAKFDNGYEATYENLVSVNVKEYDRINENSILGYFNDEFKLVITKDGVTYSYEEIRISNWFFWHKKINFFSFTFSIFDWTI